MLYVSLRIVEADNYEEAATNVINGNFDDFHELCDKIIPLNEVTLKKSRDILYDYHNYCVKNHDGDSSEEILNDYLDTLNV